MLRRPVLVLALSAALVGGLASPAMAHTELEPEQAVAGSVETLTFHVAYEGAGTTGLDVQLPDGASVVSVPDKTGWETTTDEGQQTVSWRGGPVEADEEFSVEIQLPDTTGEVLFPAVQLTTDGEVAWIDPEEEEGHDSFPAPRMTLTADPNATTTTTAAETTTTESTATTNDVPETTVEAANEGDGDAAAPWLIGAGIAAVVAIAVGGYLLKRRTDADKAAGPKAAPDTGADAPSPDGDGTAT
jgi:uncharacterized protein YcnI